MAARVYVSSRIPISLIIKYFHKQKKTQFKCFKIVVFVYDQIDENISTCSILHIAIDPYQFINFCNFITLNFYDGFCRSIESLPVLDVSQLLFHCYTMSNI